MHGLCTVWTCTSENTYGNIYIYLMIINVQDKINGEYKWEREKEYREEDNKTIEEYLAPPGCQLTRFVYLKYFGGFLWLIDTKCKNAFWCDVF